VHLLAWVQPADGGGWWAWTEPGADELVLRTGWVAAEHVRRAPGEDHAGVRRIRLPGETQGWPAPVVGSYRWPGPHQHVGVLCGQLLEPPRGARRWLWIADGDDGLAE